MNRFFSKLDLRDIKIDPEGSRFPPDADESATPVTEPDAAAAEAEEESAQAESVADTIAVHDAYEPDEHLPVESATEDNDRVGAYQPDGEVDAEPVVESYVAYESDALTDPVGSNGHLEPELLVTTVTEQGDDVLKVSAKSRPSAVAGAIAGVVRAYGRAEVQAIGAGATNQAVKAAAIARDYLRETGVDAVCLPAFIDVTIDNEDRTAIRIVIEPR